MTDEWTRLESSLESSLRWIPRMIGVTAIAIGVTMAAVSTVVVVRSWLWYGRTVVTTGTVVENRPSTSTHRDPNSVGPRTHRATTYSEVVCFADAEGREHTVESAISVSHPFAVGETVPIRYEPSDPAGARIHSWFRIWGFPLVFLAGGALFACVGAAFVLSGRSARERAGAGRA